MAAASLNPTFLQLFTPKLVTALREGYGLADFRADALAGLTVAIVALPLSMAIAIASGVGPERGLYTAIVGGFVVSLLGGSRFQIGGPAGAFIVLVWATVQAHGIEGLILATFLSGLMLLGIGFLRLGTFIKFVPYPVTVGFTAGIAIIIFASQIKDFFGLVLTRPEPGPLLEKLEVLGAAFPTVNPAALFLAAGSLGLILLVRRYRPSLPGMLIAVAAASVGAWAVGVPVETIGTRFGGIPEMLPAPHLPSMTAEAIFAVLPAALSFTLLGSIESLLSAVVADSMSGRRHRSNCELVAQGAANIASALFGGICVTGTIARTATNVRAGAHSPVAGMLHSVFLLLFMALAAPLASYIPLAALAGVLAVVAWNMVERHAFATLLRASWEDALVLLVTFVLTIFRDLTEGIVVGFSLSALLFLHRMARQIEVATGVPNAFADRPDSEGDGREAHDFDLVNDPEVAVYRVSGAFFFGAAASVGAALDSIFGHHRAYVIDLSAVPILDSTAAATIEGFVRKASREGSAVYITGTRKAVRRVLLLHGLGRPAVRYKARIDAAVADARASIRLEQPRDPHAETSAASVPLAAATPADQSIATPSAQR